MQDNRTAGQKFRDTLLLQGTGEVPIWGGFSMATWIRYGDQLIDVVERYPHVKSQWGCWPRGTDYAAQVGPANRAGEEIMDNWGCLWHCIRHGMEGQIAQHPLEDIRHLRHYKAPDPLVYTERGEHDWQLFVQECKKARAEGRAVVIGGERFFERVHFLRGMEDALADMAMGTPEIQQIVDLVLEYNLAYLTKALELADQAGGADVVNFGDDWGCQDRCMISPATFRKYFKPGYARMYELCRRHNALATQHSDGYTVDLWDEFLEAGLTAFNMQVNCVGVDVIEKKLKGRMCIVADIDRQTVMPFGTPQQVRQHVSEVIHRLGSPRGGLILRIDIYPDVPLANIDACLGAVEEDHAYWCGR